MKKNRLTMLLLFSSIFLWMCSDDDNEFKICPERCASSTPWRVESLDLNLQCFSTKDACLQWASSHGYSDKPCINCN